MITPSWQSYFYFTKKELKGIIVLGFILLGSVLISLLFTNNVKEEALKKKPMQIHLFVFDPNTIDSIHAIELGIPEKQVRTLMHYRQKGGYFKNSDSFSKLYGLQNDLFIQLSPFIKITPKMPVGMLKKSYQFQGIGKGYKEQVWKMDINNADEKEWSTKTTISLPLIRRIIAYRNYRGAFRHPSQISKVYGFPDSLYQLLKPHLFVKPGAGLVLNANAMSFKEWKEVGIFTDRQIWDILKLKKANHGKLTWEGVVEACDLSQAEALMLQGKIKFAE